MYKVYTPGSKYREEVYFKGKDKNKNKGLFEAKKNSWAFQLCWRYFTGLMHIFLLEAGEDLRNI